MPQGHRPQWVVRMSERDVVRLVAGVNRAQRFTMVLR